MNKHWQYLKYVVRHKWFVFLAGRQMGAPMWRCIIHDWSKFTPAEWGPYVRNFYEETPHWSVLRLRYGGRPNDEANLRDYEAAKQAAFDAAWLHHQHRNPHHWQHWMLQEDDGGLKLLRMPEHFVREMVADWMGAGRAITGRWDQLQWYEANCHKIKLHPDSRELVERLLGYAKTHNI